MRRYTITIEAPNPPNICLGQKLLGEGTVIALQQEDKHYVSAQQLAERYGLSVVTIRNRCAHINKGSKGKTLYDPEEAHQVLTSADKKRAGRKRIN